MATFKHNNCELNNLLRIKLELKSIIIVSNNMRKLCIKISFLLAIFFTNGIAQNGPDVILPDTAKPMFKKVMIIPFEESMYLCGVQSFLAQESGKTHDEIVKYFRESVALELQNQFLFKYNTVSLLHYNDTARDLFKAYDAVKYKFEIAPVEPEEDEEAENKTLSRAKNLFKKREVDNGYNRGYTSDGQIRSTKNTAQKFANVVVTKPESLTYLSKKYNTDLFVYITEMDIENDISNQMSFINNEYKRILKIHFSMVKEGGKVIEKGLVTVTFPNSENNINNIRTLYLPIAAKKLCDKLPFTPTPMVDPNKKGKAVRATDKVKR